MALPDASSPEGITDGPGTTSFAGSRNTGSIVVGDARTGRTSCLVDPVAPVEGVIRVVGLDHDQAEQAVVTAGGTTGLVNGYDRRTGEPGPHRRRRPGAARLDALRHPRLRAGQHRGRRARSARRPPP